MMSDGLSYPQTPSLSFAWLRCSAREHWLRIAVCLWIAFAIALTVKGYTKPNYRSTYPSFSTGARDFWRAETNYGREGYYYGPTFAFGFTPFALLPDPIGATLWNWLSLGVFLYATQRFYREFIAVRFPQASAGLFFTLLLMGSARSLWSSQSNAILIGCVLLGAVELLHKRWWRAAFCLALPVHIKIWPIAIAALLIVQYPRRLLGRWLVMVGVLAALPLLTHSPGYIANYYQAWQQSLATRQMEAVRWGGYRDAWTLWESLIGDVDKRMFSVVGLAVAGFVLAWTLGMHWKVRDPRRVLLSTIGLWGAWQMLFGPGSERLTLIILAPATVAMLYECYQLRSGRGIVTLGAVVAFLIGTGSVERMLLPLWPAAVALMPIGVILVAFAFLWPHGTVRGWIASLRASRPAPTPWPTASEA